MEKETSAIERGSIGRSEIQEWAPPKPRKVLRLFQCGLRLEVSGATCKAKGVIPRGFPGLDEYFYTDHTSLLWSRLACDKPCIWLAWLIPRCFLQLTSLMRRYNSWRTIASSFPLDSKEPPTIRHARSQNWVAEQLLHAISPSSGSCLRVCALTLRRNLV